MAIQFSGGKKIVSASNYGYFASQTSCSLSFWLRLDSDPATWGGNSILLMLNSALELAYVQMFSPTTDLIINNDNWPGFQASLAQNTWYHVALTWASGSQLVWVNGTSHSIGTLTGAIDGGAGGSDKVYVGDTDGTLSTDQFTIEQVAGWHGHVLSSGEIASIRGGTAPSALGTPCTWFYPLTKTSGTVAGTETELHDSMGVAPNLSAVTGSPTWVTGGAPSGGPTTATLSGGPSTATVGIQSTTAFTATLDQPAGGGGVVVNLAGTLSGDTFQATIGGGNVSTITISSGGTTGNFYLTPGSAGTDSISITSSGLTIAGSPKSVTVSATITQMSQVALSQFADLMRA